METWHNRLDMALNARGKTWAELHAFLTGKNGISKPSVYAWKPDATKRTTIMEGDNAAYVCHWLNVSPLWLFHGIGLSGLEENNDLADVVEKFMSLSPEKKTTAKVVMHSLAATQEAEEEAKNIKQLLPRSLKAK